MDVRSLELIQATIEIKYPTAFRAFDHAGSLCENVSAVLPNWVLSKALPNELGFGDNLVPLSATVTLDSTRISQNRPEGSRRIESLDRLKSDSVRLFSTVLSSYQVTEFARIGYRKIFQFNEKNAANLMVSWQQLPFHVVVPDGSPDQTKPGNLLLHFGFANGLFLHFRLETVEYEFTYGHTKVDLTRSRIYGIPIAKREAATSILAVAEKGTENVPRFAFTVDLDWYREDCSLVDSKFIESFISECEGSEAMFLRLLAKVNR